MVCCNIFMRYTVTVEMSLAQLTRQESANEAGPLLEYTDVIGPTIFGDFRVVQALDVCSTLRHRHCVCRSFRVVPN